MSAARSAASPRLPSEPAQPRLRPPCAGVRSVPLVIDLPPAPTSRTEYARTDTVPLAKTSAARRRSLYARERSCPSAQTRTSLNRGPHLFNETSTTSFGATFTMTPTSLVCIPAAEPHSPSVNGNTSAIPLLQLWAPDELLVEGFGQSTSFARLGFMKRDAMRIGVAMAYTAGHYAMVMYDHGEPEVKEMSQHLLAKGRAHLVLRSEDHFTLPVVTLTEPMRQSLQASIEQASPSAFSEFVDAIADTRDALQTADTYRAMGVDPLGLRSVTLSVCVPPRGQGAGFAVLPVHKVQ
jgi:hypothetical protein